MSTYRHPGVYIQELSSEVHTITGVATSIAAFIGWANQGPTDQAVLVQSWSDFSSKYGGLTRGSYLGYAVDQFFTNGGQQAYIVRLAWTDCATATSASVGGTMKMWAANPGAWANTSGPGLGLQVQVTISATDSTRFTLQVLSAAGQLLESFDNLSVTPADPQYVVAVIDNDSKYVTFRDPATPGTVPVTPTTPSASTTASFSGGTDGTILQPGDGKFENRLGAAAAASNDYGLGLLNRVNIFNLLCVPGENDAATIGELQSFCAAKRAFLIVDAPQTVTAAILGSSGPVGTGPGDIWVTVAGQAAQRNSAYYYPWIEAPDPLVANGSALFPPCGVVAGVYAATDAAHGVWKAPAGLDTGLAGVDGLEYQLTDAEIETLNPQGINCLRQFESYGNVVWGARTLSGSDQAGSQWQYIPTRRLGSFIESSLHDGTQWVVFEPSDERLWGQIRLDVDGFMQTLFMGGAFQGTTPQEAYFVKCDADNNPQTCIDQGIVNISVGFAPLEPAEFVVISIQHIAGRR